VGHAAQTGETEKKYEDHQKRLRNPDTDGKITLKWTER
jgi:hypothetical protein